VFGPHKVLADQDAIHACFSETDESFGITEAAFGDPAHAFWRLLEDAEGVFDVDFKGVEVSIVDP
jgi:hypothetical protein